MLNIGEKVKNVPRTPKVHCLARCSSASLLSSIFIVCGWLYKKDNVNENVINEKDNVINEVIFAS